MNTACIVIESDIVNSDRETSLTIRERVDCMHWNISEITAIFDLAVLLIISSKALLIESG